MDFINKLNETIAKTTAVLKELKALKDLPGIENLADVGLLTCADDDCDVNEFTIILKDECYRYSSDTKMYTNLDDATLYSSAKMQSFLLSKITADSSELGRKLRHLCLTDTKANRQTVGSIPEAYWQSVKL